VGEYGELSAGKGGQTSTLWIVGRKSKLKKKEYIKYHCQSFRLFLKILSGLVYGDQMK
jgi:hypothetical protein